MSRTGVRLGKLPMVRKNGECRLEPLSGPNSTCLLPLNVRMETDQVFETLCPLEYRTVDKVQKSSNLHAKHFLFHAILNFPMHKPCMNFTFQYLF
jgi:hypothetical protein